MQLSSRVEGDRATLELKLGGNGKHSLELRLFNATSADTSRQVTLRLGVETTLKWSLRINCSDAPWVGVIIADGRPAVRQECFGRVGMAPGLAAESVGTNAVK